MNGIHDFGGKHGFGPVVPEADEPVFHAEWEKRVFGLFASTFVFAGYSVDEFRHAIEQLPPAEYLETSYYEHWLHGFEQVLAVRGIVTADELAARVAQLKQQGGV